MNEVSSKPWSDFKESDYSLEQWRRACLISPPEPSESKADYKLPVKEPSGTLNRNACHSAAAALAGARGGVNAPEDRKKAAAKRLIGLYRNQLEEDPPDSLLRLAGELVEMAQQIDDFLAHYGVKGMKWGVRRAEKRLARQTAKNFRRYSVSTVKERRAGKRLTSREYENLSEKVDVIARGTELRRISRNPATTLPARAYVSTLMEDSIKYRAILPLRGDPTKRQRKDYGEQYEITMKATRRLTSPSPKARVDTFIELMDSKSIQVPGKAEPITGREYLSRMGYGRELRQLNSQEAGLRFYSAFNAKAGDANSPINTAYFNRISQQGYNYVVDDNDIGFISRKPMILLGPEGTVKVTDVRPLTAEQINQAQLAVFGPKRE